MLINVKIIGRPSFQIVNIVLFCNLDHKVCLFSLYFWKNFFKWVFLLISIVVMELIHIKCKIWKHFVIKFIEQFILFRILAMSFSQNISEYHKHSFLSQHFFQFIQHSFICEKVKGLTYCNHIEFICLGHLLNTLSLEVDMGVALNMLLNIIFSSLNHVFTQIYCFCFFKTLTKV